MPNPAPPQPPYPAIETMPVGKLTCQFIQFDDFLALCRRWLAERQLRHIVTLNPEMVMQAEEDTAFREAVQAADIRLPDGAGLIWAHWYERSQFWSLWPSLIAFSFRQVNRIPGVELVEKLVELCAQESQPVYLLGGTVAQVRGTAERLRRKFPNAIIYTSAGHRFSLDGPAAILADIQARQPAVLFVAYGAPKQSIWIERHRAHLPSVRITVGVGGAFAILSEDRPRAPHLFRRFNLEWLWRLLLEPSRLPRIWQATVRFPLLIKQQKVDRA